MAIDKNTVIKDAQKYASKGQFDKAIAEWKKLLRESPHDANLYNTIGDLCLKKDAKNDAVDAYKKAADILNDDGFSSKAIALYKKVLNIDPQKVEVHLILGDLNADKGLTSNALASYKVAADFYTQQKDNARALGIYQKMADLNPTNLAFRIKLADMYGKEGMIEEATRAYLDAADVHISQNALTEARQLFEKILTIDPNNKDVYFKAGVVYLKEGKFSDACKALKPAFEKDPANPELADTYLDALNRAGKKNEAESVMKTILAEDPGRSALRRTLYQLYMDLGEHEKALGEALTLVHEHMGRDEHDSAEETLKNFVADAPQFAPGRQKLGEYYVSARRKDDAANAFLQAAEILSEDGDREGAVAAIHRALDNAPDLREAVNLLDRLTMPASTPVSEPDPEPMSEATAAVLDSLSESVPYSAEEPRPLEDLPQEVPLQEAEPAAMDPVFADLSETGGEFTGPDAELYAGESMQEVSSPAAEASAEAPVQEFSETGAEPLAAMAADIPEAVEYAPPADSAPEPASAVQLEEASPAATVEEPEAPTESVEPLPAEPAPVPEAPREPVEDPAVRTACIEIEVLAKYGLITKAIEQLETLATRFPESILVRIKLRDLYGDQGSMKKAANHMLVLARLYEKNGLADEALSTLRSAAELDPNNPEIISKLGIAPSEPVIVPEPPAQPERFAVSVEYVPPPPPDDAAPYASAFPFAEPEEGPLSAFGTEPEPPEAPAAAEPAQTEADAFADFDAALFDGPSEARLAESTPMETASEDLGAASLPLQEPVAAVPALEGSSPDEGAGAHAEDESVSPASKSAEKINISEIWAEAEFYFQQGLYEEAKAYYEKILTLKPGATLAVARLAELSREEAETKEFSKLAEAVEGLENAFAENSAGELPMTDADEDAVRTLMNEIAQLSPPEHPAPPVMPPTATPPAAQAEVVKKAPVSAPEKPALKAPSAAAKIDKEAPVHAPEKPAPAKKQPAPKPLAPFQQAADELAASKAAKSRPAPTPPPAPVGEKVKAPPPPGFEHPVAAPAFSRHKDEDVVEGVELRSDDAGEGDYFDLGAELAADTESMAAPAAAKAEAPASDDFFDLAAELRDELSSAPAPTRSVPAEEQSLDEIFEEFKRGVELKSSKEDADTHYNLGVAYKEMGLLDDAINEFVMTPEDESKFIQSRYMLGLCYMEKGEYKSAIGEIQNALDYSETLGDGTLDPIGMHYDLGLAHQGAGNINEALVEFQAVYAAAPNYLDVVTKIREIRQGRAVSATRLKNDIDKEITSKFLSEGARIEREEKHKKSEKIKH